MSLDKTLKARKKTPADKVREAGASLNARFAKLRGATPESRARASPRAVYAAFARKRNVRRGLWRQPNVAALAEQLALSDYKTPAAQRATRS